MKKNGHSMTSLGMRVLALVALTLPYLLQFDRSHMAISLIVGIVICGVSLYSRHATVVLALLSIVLGIAFKGQNVAYMVGLAFAIAASAIWPKRAAPRIACSSGNAL